MANKSFEKLFRPQSVAVIGASDRPGSFGCFAAVNAVESIGALRYYLINERKAELFGVKTYKRIQDLPECPELVMIATPARVVNKLIYDAAEMGVRDFIVFSSGFAEDQRCDGKAMEQEMADLAKKYDLRIIGPNCCGVLNNIDKLKLWGTADVIDMNTRGPGVAVLGHSGGYTCSGINRNWIGVSYGVSGGNGSIVSQEEMAEYCIDDPNTTAVVTYMEGMKKPDVFYRLLKKGVEMNKPIVILKSGRSKKGAISAASHTGNLAGSYEQFKAVFDKYGVLSADGVEEFYGLEQVIGVMGDKLPKRNRFAIVCRSGGEATMSSDLAERYGIELPDFDQSTVDRLNEMMPDFGSAKNPLDMTAGLLGDQKMLRRMFEIIGEDPNIDAIVAAFDFDANMADTGFDMNDFMGQPVLDYVAQEGSKPVFMMPQYEALRDNTWRQKLATANIPILPPAEIGYKILGKLAEHMAYDSSTKRLEWAVPEHYPENAVAMTEYASKQELANAGIPVPKQVIIQSIKELDTVCAEFGFPLVLKINSPDILHKTEAGGVKLRIQSLEDAQKAFEEIMVSCKAFNPQARLEGILVQQMAKAGTEMIIGVKNDRQLGPMLLTGMGGVFVEVFKDVSLVPCPISYQEALEQIGKLKSAKLLKGYRGSKPCDIDALAKLMVSISEYAAANKNSLKEMDINPVYVYEEGQGVCVVDALIIKE